MTRGTPTLTGVPGPPHILALLSEEVNRPNGLLEPASQLFELFLLPQICTAATNAKRVQMCRTWRSSYTVPATSVPATVPTSAFGLVTLAAKSRVRRVP